MQIWACPNAPECTATAHTIRASAEPQHHCSTTDELTTMDLVEGELVALPPGEGDEPVFLDAE